MTQNDLANALASLVEETERTELLRTYPGLLDKHLGALLKDICLDSWTSNPQRAVAAAQSLSLLALLEKSRENRALAAWSDGVAAMINGQLRRAVLRFDAAREKFLALDESYSAASTQVAKLYPLAMLGRFDEAIETGLWAIQIFDESGDVAAIGRVEHNLGNIYQLTDRYKEAEQLLRAGRDRFAELGDTKTLAKITNSLAYVLSYRYKFDEAERMYDEAFKLALEAGLEVTKAEIESNQGYFSLFQGRYDRALKFLERARTSYATLGMPTQSAIAELEMADAYLELNLHAEAAATYARVLPVFAESGMPVEHARALANFARVKFVEGYSNEAHSLMTQARKIFASCKSALGESNVLLGEAQFHFAQGRYTESLDVLSQAELPLTTAGLKGSELLADFLRAESLRMLGKTADAEVLLEEVLEECESNHIPHLSTRCLTALGMTAKDLNSPERAEDFYRKAIALIEGLRSPLPSEDFRTAFFGDKLAPYRELARICLSNPHRFEEGFELIERSRSRSLIELVNRTSNDQTSVSEIDEKSITSLREQLNWLYNQLYQPTSKNAARQPEQIEQLYEKIGQTEEEIAELYRRIQLRDTDVDAANIDPFKLAELQKHLGDDTVLVEYAEFDGALTAIVITHDTMNVFPAVCLEAEISELLTRLYFQIEALRNNPRAVDSYMYELTLRTRRILGKLYERLLMPIESLIRSRRLVIVPHGCLTYVPFHALYDGFGYLIEDREVCFSPSATMLKTALDSPWREPQTALFAGVSDDRIPYVRQEIEQLSSTMPGEMILGTQATRAEIIARTAGKDILHLACHGQFRPANPLFSSLMLSDGWLTVRDLYSVKLDPELVVLSACETGMSHVAPGEELLGLSRGFFASGAKSLVVSLWNVHDETTTQLMQSFYRSIRDGFRPASALRSAQIEMMNTRPHPFFWSPFIVIGRW